MSYPSSCSNSRILSKQNVDPNVFKIRPKGYGLSPDFKPKQISLSSSHRISKQSQDFMSEFGTIVGKQTIEQAEKQSMRAFCSTIQETQQSAEPQQFWQLIQKLRNDKPMHRREMIDFCLKQQIYNKEDIYSYLEQKGNSMLSASTKSTAISTPFKNKHDDIKFLLSSDLGQLVIQQICEYLQEGCSLSQEQDKIIQFLVPCSNQDITPSVIAQYYGMFKEDLALQNLQRKKLESDYRIIHNSRIVPQLWSDHFRLEIGKALNFKQSKSRISFNCFSQIFNKFLTQSQISTMFRYIYCLETNIMMPILDSSKTLCINLLQANILQTNQQAITRTNPQQKLSSLAFEQMYSQISTYQKDQAKHLDMLHKKDQEIERLNRIIDLLKLEQEQTTRISKQNLQIQLQSMSRKYQKKIQQVEASKQEQAKLTAWYQRELEAIMKSVNKQNVMGRYLALDQL